MGISNDIKYSTRDSLVSADLLFFTAEFNIDGQEVLNLYNYTFNPSSRNTTLYVMPADYDFVVPEPCPAPTRPK
jgi:hypothetical protein